MSASLVGSEMCIRDRFNTTGTAGIKPGVLFIPTPPAILANLLDIESAKRGWGIESWDASAAFTHCLLYTSPSPRD
eukprot:831196-Alexandrium_andersonii.AAC.1